MCFRFVEQVGEDAVAAQKDGDRKVEDIVWHGLPLLGKMRAEPQEAHCAPTQGPAVMTEVRKVTATTTQA